jgi:hypothetical protein
LTLLLFLYNIIQLLRLEQKQKHKHVRVAAKSFAQCES